MKDQFGGKKHDETLNWYVECETFEMIVDATVSSHAIPPIFLKDCPHSVNISIIHGNFWPAKLGSQFSEQMFFFKIIMPSKYHRFNKTGFMLFTPTGRFHLILGPWTETIWCAEKAIAFWCLRTTSCSHHLSKEVLDISTKLLTLLHIKKIKKQTRVIFIQLLL